MTPLGWPEFPPDFPPSFYQTTKVHRPARLLLSTHFHTEPIAVNGREHIHAGYVSFLQLLRLEVGALPAVNWSLVSIDHVVVGITAIVIARAKSRAPPGSIELLPPCGLAAGSTLALGASNRARHICLTYFQGGILHRTVLTIDIRIAVRVRADIVSHEIDGKFLPINPGASEGSCSVARSLTEISIVLHGRSCPCDHTRAYVMVIVARAPRARTVLGALVDEAQRNLRATGYKTIDRVG